MFHHRKRGECSSNRQHVSTRTPASCLLCPWHKNWTGLRITAACLLNTSSCDPLWSTAPQRFSWKKAEPKYLVPTLQTEAVERPPLDWVPQTLWNQPYGMNSHPFSNFIWELRITYVFSYTTYPVSLAICHCCDIFVKRNGTSAYPQSPLVLSWRAWI